MYLVRSQLLLLYVACLFATGLAPLVRMIERQRVLPIGTKRLPRAAAILVIYGAVLGTIAGIGAAVVPPMVRQSQEFWKALPQLIDQGQARLVSWGLISPDASYKELLERVPSGGGDVGDDDHRHALGLCWWDLRIRHHAAADVLHAGGFAEPV